MRSIESRLSAKFIALDLFSAVAIGTLAIGGCNREPETPAPKASWETLISDDQNGISVHKMTDKANSQICYVVTNAKESSSPAIACPPQVK